MPGPFSPDWFGQSAPWSYWPSSLLGGTPMARQDARERADASPDDPWNQSAAGQGTTVAPLPGTSAGAYPGAGRGILAPLDRPPDLQSFGAVASPGAPLGVVNAAESRPTAGSSPTSGFWPSSDEAEQAMEARRVAAWKTGQNRRRDPFVEPLPESISPPTSSYLAPVPQAPRWEQVAPAGTPASVWPKLPSPTSWGDIANGVECTDSGGGTTCVSAGGHIVPLRAGIFPPGGIHPGQPNYHYYDTPDGPVRVDPSVLTQGIIDRPTVGPLEGVRPATPEGTLNEATPNLPYRLFEGAVLNAYGGVAPPPDQMSMSPVKSYLTKDQNGLPIVVNVTEPGHPLYPGIVFRYVTTTPSGSTIQNEGSGLGWLQAPGAYFAGPIGRVWQGQSQDIIKKMQPNSP